MEREKKKKEGNRKYEKEKLNRKRERIRERNTERNTDKKGWNSREQRETEMDLIGTERNR